MPTFDEIKELLGNCNWEWTTLNGVNGQKVTGPNGNSIFLPAAGGYMDFRLESAGSFGNYWSSPLDLDYDDRAYYLSLYSDGSYYGCVNRNFGQSVRAVCP